MNIFASEAIVEVNSKNLVVNQFCNEKSQEMLLNSILFKSKCEIFSLTKNSPTIVWLCSQLLFRT